MEYKKPEKYKLKHDELSVIPNNNFKKICCTSCNAEIPAVDLNINDKIAKCTHCNILFSFQSDIADLLEPKKIKQEVIRPEGIDIFYFQDDLDITIKQPLTTLEIIGVSLLPLISFIVSAICFEENLSFIFPGLLWLFTFYVASIMIFRSRHKVHLSVDDKFLSIKWRPKKFKKDKFYPVSEIDQIYINSLNGYSSIMMIVDGVNGQKHVELISGIDSLSKARFLEQEIEWHLDITDRKVPEESA